MWVKLRDGSYLNLETDRVLKVSQNNATVPTYRVGAYTQQSLNASGILMDGYATGGDAQAALDEMMDGLDVLRIQPPVQPEEAVTDDDESADDDEEIADSGTPKNEGEGL